MERLRQQLDFIVEIDRLKTILRQTVLTDGSRRENTAEHSWHLAVMALLLSEYAEGEIDLLRAVKMVLVHDIVEIDAGDTFCYDAEANTDKAQREARAADRLFGLLPADQKGELRQLWDEFEARESMEARFANALDRMQPILQNLATGGHSWRVHGIRKEQVIERNHPIAEGSEVLWREILARIEELYANDSTLHS
jgi:putative hydrolase of HD superfamily